MSGSFQQSTTPTGKALNKPQLLVGIDKRILGLGLLLPVLIGSGNGSKIAAGIAFLSACTVGRWLSRKDPNMLLILIRVRRQKALYDPVKRELFRLKVSRG